MLSVEYQCTRYAQALRNLEYLLLLHPREHIKHFIVLDPEKDTGHTGAAESEGN